MNFGGVGRIPMGSLVVVGVGAEGAGKEDGGGGGGICEVRDFRDRSPQR